MKYLHYWKFRRLSGRALTFVNVPIILQNDNDAHQRRNAKMVCTYHARLKYIAMRRLRDASRPLYLVRLHLQDSVFEGEQLRHL